MSRKILFTDLDGTLLMSNHKISQNTRNHLINMMTQGHLLVLSSGRPLASILSVKDAAGLNYPGMFLIANNGSTIYNCDTKEIIFDKKLSYEDTMYLMRSAWNQNLYTQTYTDTHILSGGKGSELDFYRTKVDMPYFITKNPVEYMEHPPYKVLAISLTDKPALESFRYSLLPFMEDRVTAIFSNDNYLEFFSGEAGKGNALVYLCNYLNVPIENSFAAGDAENDLSMLESAGTGVCMVNGDSILKQASDYITENDNDHDGLVEVITKYICNEN